MATAQQSGAAPVPGAASLRAPGTRTARHGSIERSRGRMSYLFVSGYTVLLFTFGLAPTLYAAYLSLTKEGQFVGFDNFVQVIQDFRFGPAVLHVALFVLFWLAGLVLFVVVLSLLVHGLASRGLSTGLRFVYYIPGALAGASSVMLWLFVLDPTVSPVSWVLHAMGMQTFVQTVSPANLPVIFAIIAFWTGAGGWIVVLYGALNNVPGEVMEAAKIDGAGRLRTALSIQLPMMRKWISYMAVMSLAAGTQLFVEPRILSQASKGVVPVDYSLNQLAYLYAFKQTDHNGSAAIAILLLVVSLGLSMFFVIKGGLFERD
ncbi:carbohydrate ABC transporter permease [Promicromonospora soli]|uniref:Sugar ABC transporter permease n=1 Tax=Promicromonospora soli TaxID=2035533 RepID=A0A919KNH0_9MICO|nr:sugar ABC transporter permease [Promicromonospora soli]GHH65407.1 sugar ABC transporter permease [Promicromonospora soli]